MPVEKLCKGNQQKIQFMKYYRPWIVTKVLWIWKNWQKGLYFKPFCDKILYVWKIVNINSINIKNLFSNFIIQIVVNQYKKYLSFK